jgi:hypothetical protein
MYIDKIAKLKVESDFTLNEKKRSFSHYLHENGNRFKVQTSFPWTFVPFFEQSVHKFLDSKLKPFSPLNASYLQK